MTRLLQVLFHNWPLKLAAIALATLLYGGFVVSQSAQNLPGPIPINVLNQRADAYLVTVPPPVREIRYVIADGGLPPSADTFRATIDLTGVDPNAGTTYVPVRVEATDPRITILGYDPPGVNVRVEPVISKTVAVTVVPGPMPSGLDVRLPVVDPANVTVRGPRSAVDRVAEVRANVLIEPSGINVDRQVELVPVDLVGGALPNVAVTPSTAHVSIAILNDATTRSLPVNPIVNGTPGSGYEIASITVSPLSVLVEGGIDQLKPLLRADTTPVAIGGATQNVVSDVKLALPPGVLSVGDATVRVTIALRPIAGTRTFDSAVVLAGARSDLLYSLSVRHALATVGGSTVDLDRLDGAAFTLLAQVGGLGPGIHQVKLEANLPVGLALDIVVPAAVTVTISVPPSPSPTSGP